MSILNGFSTYTSNCNYPTVKRSEKVSSEWGSLDDNGYCEIHEPTLREKIKYTIDKQITKFLTNLLPTKTKRLFFIASLIASIKDISDPEDSLLLLINNKFNLSNSQEALAFPVWAGVNLWYGRVPKNLCLKCNGEEPLLQLSGLNGKRMSHGEMRIAANSVINCAPNWIKYGSRRVMRNDFVAILEFVQVK